MVKAFFFFFNGNVSVKPRGKNKYNAEKYKKKGEN